MNRELLIQCIENPETINSVSLSEIEKLLEQYPYFQTARIIYISALKLNNSILFNDKLKESVIYISNREKLYTLLHPKQTIVFEENIEVENIITETFSEINEEIIPESIEEPLDKDDTIVVPLYQPSNTDLYETDLLDTTNEETVALPDPSIVDKEKHEVVDEQILYRSIEDTIDPDTIKEKQEVVETTEQIISIETIPSEPEENIDIISIPIEPIVESLVEEIITAKIEEKTTEPEQKEESLADIILKRIQRIKEQENLHEDHARDESELFSIHDLVPTSPKEFQETISTEKPIQEVEIESKVEIIEIKEEIQTEKLIELENRISESSDAELLEFSFIGDDSIDNKKEKLDELTEQYASETWFNDSELEFENLNQNNLIDTFLSKQITIKPKEIKPTENQKDISEESVKEGEYLSETLAKIYITQKNFTKAIQIYKKLSLKFPQKSVYFANQILEIEKNLK